MYIVSICSSLSLSTGDIFGGWLHGMRTVLPDYSDEIHKIILFSLSPDTKPEVPVPGPIILSRLLPYHLSSPQTFLLIIGLLLGTPVTEVRGLSVVGSHQKFH